MHEIYTTYLKMLIAFTENAIRPCEVSCKSYTQDDDIHMNVSWKLCPYEQFVGYVDNYFVILNCSDVSWF